MTSTLVVVIALLIFVYVVSPLIATKTMQFAAEPQIERIDSDDPRLPASVRRFFSNVIPQLQEQGFELGDYLTDTNTTPNTTLFVAVLLNHSARDAVAAIAGCMRSKPAIEIQNYSVNFASEFVDGTAVETCNSTHATSLGKIAWKKVYVFPEFADLSVLYQVHRGMTVRHGGISKKPLPARDQLASRTGKDMIRDFEGFVDSGNLYLDAGQAKFRLTLKGGLLAAWRLTPPFKQLRHWLLKRRARRILHELNLPSDYPTTDYRS
ncbi:MAG: hypothetical protein IIA66_03640 [Planctomycetes bacterium]|nr:hypothetical protein [Planctomycetota bacterium]